MPKPPTLPRSYVAGRAILQDGDVVIYYSPYNHGGYGREYAFRGEELLYIGTNHAHLSTELGPNYMKHVKELADNIPEAVFDLVFWDLFGRGVQGAGKGFGKAIKKMVK